MNCSFLYLSNFEALQPDLSTTSHIFSYSWSSFVRIVFIFLYIPGSGGPVHNIIFEIPSEAATTARIGHCKQGLSPTIIFQRVSVWIDRKTRFSQIRKQCENNVTWNRTNYAFGGPDLDPEPHLWRTYYNNA